MSRTIAASRVAAFSVLPIALTAILALSFPQLSSAAIVYQEWNISYTELAPDCVTMGRPAINGQMPGPPIYAVDGDRIQIKVCNNMYYNVSIHWHGMNMQQQNWFDGSVYGVQCPIKYNECFLYDFIAYNVTGTFWYHGHIDLLRASVYGALIIYPHPKDLKAPYKVDGEHIVIMSDWYHRTNSDILNGLESSNWQFIGEPDSLLVNGRGMVYCANYQCPAPPMPCGKCDRSNPKCNPLSHFDVQPGKTYLFRLLNVGLWGQLNFEIKGHNLTLVRADGYFTKPLVTSSIDINPGMAFDVLVTMDQKPNNYWIGVNGVYDNIGINPPGLAVVKYMGSPVFNQTQPYDAFPTGPDAYDTKFGYKQQAQFRNYNNVQALSSRKVDAYYSMRINQNMIGPYVRYSINNHSFVRPETPLLVSEYFKLDTSVFSTLNELPHAFPAVNPKLRGLQPAQPGVSVLSIKTGDFVQIVLNNHNPPGGNHPFHIHGNPFYVMGYFPGEYDPAKEAHYAKKYNYVDPPQRNMVTIYQDYFVVIRFLADNPGLWNMHCHMEPHMILGMQLFLRVSSDTFGSDIQKPPADYPICGALSAQLLKTTRLARGP